MNPKAKILVVDDDKALTRLLKTRLVQQGYEVATSWDGRDALKQYDVFQPNLILLDLLMPEIDGYAFVAELKKRDQLKKVAIIVITSVITIHDVFQLEGVNDFVMKPVVMEKLLAKIEKRLRSQKKHVLVVDDEKEVAEGLARRLTFSGYQVTMAYDGECALNMAKEEHPDLMILDVMMPKLNGYHVCRALKLDPQYQNIPVILLTALGVIPDQGQGEEFGANACFSKPYDGKELLHKIKELIWD
ncbi:MAG: response regulator [Candidatus Omnitrophica bacterium]|nr:response regulator [Candidatus Omnitrophota bacterium]